MPDEVRTRGSSRATHTGHPELTNYPGPDTERRAIDYMAGAIGFLIGFMTVFITEAAIILFLQETSGVRIMPRGPGWLVVPVTAGIAGWHAAQGSKLRGQLGHAVREMVTMNKTTRLLLASCASWAIVVGAYLITVRPYGYYVAPHQWVEIAEAAFVPMVVAAIIVFIFRIACQEDNRDH